MERTNSEQAGPENQRGPISKLLVLLSIGLLNIWHAGARLFLGNTCRFEPSCSRYAVEALKRHGFFKGWHLSIRRVVRCNPRCAGGEDPVP